MTTPSEAELRTTIERIVDVFRPLLDPRDQPQFMSANLSVCRDELKVLIADHDAALEKKVMEAIDADDPVLGDEASYYKNGWNDGRNELRYKQRAKITSIFNGGDDGSS